jgi:hypothetical protein
VHISKEVSKLYNNLGAVGAVGNLGVHSSRAPLPVPVGRVGPRANETGIASSSIVVLAVGV